MWHLTLPVKSHKAQLEAMRSSKQSDFERDFEERTSMIESAFGGKRSMLESASEGKRSMLEQCFRALSGLKARSSSDFELAVEKAAPVQCFRVLSRQFGAIRSPIRAENLYSYILY